MLLACIRFTLTSIGNYSCPLCLHSLPIFRAKLATTVFYGGEVEHHIDAKLDQESSIISNHSHYLWAMSRQIVIHIIYSPPLPELDLMMQQHHDLSGSVPADTI